jgi:hypothetical protein
MNEYEHEPVRGLPELLPEGEALLWQGQPRWRSLALRVFHVRSIGLYFSLLVVVHLASQLLQGERAGAALLSTGWQLGLGALALGILSLLAYLYARATIYTLTDRRLVMRIGVAVPMMINIPWETIESADLRDFGDGTGDIALTPIPGKRLSYWALWPNVRPWRYARVQPMLRGIPDAQEVAGLLAGAVAATAQEEGPALHTRTRGRPRPGNAPAPRGGSVVAVS